MSFEDAVLQFRHKITDELSELEDIDLEEKMFNAIWPHIEKLITVARKTKVELEQTKDKIQAFEKWLALGTPFESAKFDHKKVLEEYCKTFSDVLQSREGQEK